MYESLTVENVMSYFNNENKSGVKVIGILGITALNSIG